MFQFLMESEKAIKNIEKSIETLESVETARVEYQQLTIEKEWARVSLKHDFFFFFKQKNHQFTNIFMKFAGSR